MPGKRRWTATFTVCTFHVAREMLKSSERYAHFICVTALSGQIGHKAEQELDVGDVMFPRQNPRQDTLSLLQFSLNKVPQNVLCFK